MGADYACGGKLVKDEFVRMNLSDEFVRLVRTGDAHGGIEQPAAGRNAKVLLRTFLNERTARFELEDRLAGA